MVFFTMARPRPTPAVSRSLPPEAFKYPLSLFDWNPWTTVGDAYAAVQQHLDRHLFVARRMRDGIFDKISDRVFDRISVPWT